jgi:hypothetical protein
VADQLTAVFLALPTLAVNACVDEGHPSAALFGQRLTAAGLIPTVTGALPPPHATKIPRKASVMHMPMPEYLDDLRPIMPTITKPAIGIVNGSHGERERDLFSARLCCNAGAVV